MSLLPEFNEKFEDLLYDTITIDTMFAKDRGRSPELWTTCASLRALQKLLNPDLNPLTFEEVKAWFDRKAKEGRGEIIYGDTHAHESYGNVYYLYHIHKANYYHRYIASDGFKYSLNSSEKHGFYELIESDKAHYSLCELLNLTPLELFCQMKGYVNI